MPDITTTHDFAILSLDNNYFAKSLTNRTYLTNRVASYPHFNNTKYSVNDSRSKHAVSNTFSNPTPSDNQHTSSPTLSYVVPPPAIHDTPMLARSDRDTSSSSSASISEPPSTALDISVIADAVFAMLEEKIKTEKERRGYW